MKVDVHDRLEAVGPAAWDDLLARARHRSPFLSWTWQSEWAAVFAADRRLEVRCAEDADGRLAAILPLYEAEAGTWCLLGGVDISDYLDLIAVEGREADAWLALLQGRAAEPVVWELHAVPAASPTVSALPGLARASGLSATVTLEERCPVLALPGSWEAYLAGLSGKHRHELTRKLRRFEREAPDARVTCLRRGEDIRARLGDFLDLHRRSGAGKTRFMDARMETFFRRAANALADRDAVRLWFLDLPAGPAAAFLCLEWDGRVGLYNSGFHPDLAGLSPGLVLLSRVIRDAIERGQHTFDFLRGEERYKYEFGPVPEAVYQVVIEPAARTPRP